MSAYDQPFYVGFGPEAKRFRGIRSGYLPALELPEPTKEVYPDEHYFAARIQQAVQATKQTQALVVDLQKRLNEHIDRTRRKDRL